MNKAKPLSSEGHMAIRTPRTLNPAESPFTGPIAYSLGWNIKVYQGVEVIEHTGTIDGFGANVSMIPELKFTAITMGNTMTTSIFAGIVLTYHLIDENLRYPLKTDSIGTQSMHMFKYALASHLMQ